MCVIWGNETFMQFIYVIVFIGGSGAVAQRRSGAAAQRRSGAAAQRRSGAAAQWRSGSIKRLLV